jgi:hypothetical protein
MHQVVDQGARARWWPRVRVPGGGQECALQVVAQEARVSEGDFGVRARVPEGGVGVQEGGVGSARRCVCVCVCVCV